MRLLYIQINRSAELICLHNEYGLCLMVVTFTTVYICTSVDGQEDVLMILLTDLHALLIFLEVQKVE